MGMDRSLVFPFFPGKSVPCSLRGNHGVEDGMAYKSFDRASAK